MGLDRMRSKAVIFLGPSAPISEASRILPSATFRPPAGRGDIAAAADEGFEIIGLIDGVFYQRNAVAHREITYAIGRGAIVIGGSSMGALRASEMDACGMVGVGKIYRWYKDGKIVSDDEVALVFHPETLAPISEPMVNIRATLDGLAESGDISAEEEETVVRAASETPFQFRNISRICQRALRAGLPPERCRTIAALLKERRIDQKRLDAIKLLEEVRTLMG
ncbi:MAG TPA: TfuA-related McrA-glycine thioamidation protein [Candidatus Methanomethylicus sp.]|nr:TfuA-related McrA-glycine thioamidation protein [Candidatus Methanomethylicus sp.]